MDGMLVYRDLALATLRLCGVVQLLAPLRSGAVKPNDEHCCAILGENEARYETR